jgi:hypothetical protein
VLSTYGELRASVRLSSCTGGTMPAVTAILRIEALAREPFAKPLNVRGIGEKENAVRDIVPPHRTERKPTAEFVDDKIVASCRAS